MRTAIAVVAVLMAAGLSGCAMSPDGCGGCNPTGFFCGSMQGCNNCDSGCNDCASSCGDCGGGCNGCSTGYQTSMFPGPFSSWKMRNAGSDCASCETPRLGMGELAMFARDGSRMSARGCGQNGCGLRGQLCNECNLASRVRGRVEQFRNRDRVDWGSMLASTEPVMNETSGGLLSGGLFGGGLQNGGMANGGMANGGLMNGGLLNGGLGAHGCGPNCNRCGGRGCGLPRLGLRGDPAAQHPYGGQIPHTDGFNGPQGPVSPTYAYPYYTTRGPRDFFVDDPPTIGR